jgi:hypothetical protein
MSDFKKYLNVYQFETTLPGTGELIQFKPITTGQIKKLLVYEDSKDLNIIETVMDDLIMSSVITEDFNVDDLYLQDRFFLLIEIRKYSKGKHYNFEIKCPQCDSQSLQSIDLDNLPSTLKSENIDYSIKINDNITVTVDYVKRIDQKMAIDFVDSSDSELQGMQKLAEISVVATALAIKSIVTPEGADDSVSLEDRVFFLDSLSQQEFETVTGWFEENSYGIDFEFELKCHHEPCSFKQKIEIPLENFFF